VKHVSNVKNYTATCKSYIYTKFLNLPKPKMIFSWFTIWKKKNSCFLKFVYWENTQIFCILSSIMIISQSFIWKIWRKGTTWKT